MDCGNPIYGEYHGLMNERTNQAECALLGKYPHGRWILQMTDEYLGRNGNKYQASVKKKRLVLVMWTLSLEDITPVVDWNLYPKNNNAVGDNNRYASRKA